MLNERFPDLPIFNAAKLFSPRHYPADEENRTRTTDIWLEMLMEKFVHCRNYRDAYRAEILDFVKTIRHECPHKFIHEAWSLCGCTLE